MSAVNQVLSSVVDQVLASPLAVAAISGFSMLIVGVMLCQWFNSTFLDVATDKTEPDKEFQNGVSLVFILKVMIQGPSLDTIVKILSKRSRKRLYVAHKRWIFFGPETWWVGHPAIAKHAFGAAQQKMWRKFTKDETLRLFYLPPETKANQRQAMLYTGDDERWRTSRACLSPFFYTYDFTKLDERMDIVVQKHLKRVAIKHHGEDELLELALTITVDLICQCLYRCALPDDELFILVDCMAEYIVPGTSKKGVYPGGLTTLQYHNKVAIDMAEDAPPETLAYIIKHESPAMSETLKNENLAFFLEALTPAFASFWTLCNVMMMSKEEKLKVKDDAVFRQQCIKEALRMYPPVPILWPRTATVDQELPNPLYDPMAESDRGFFERLFYGPSIEKIETIKIKKGTSIVLFPGVYHYDPRFWVRPLEYLPSRWDKEPDILQGDSARLEARKRQTAFPGLIGSRQSTLGASSGRASMMGSKARSYGVVSKSLRAKIFSVKSEMLAADAARDFLAEATLENIDELQAWSFLPFGLGPHTCLGRRLAIRMVDSIVFNFLEYEVSYYNGVIPSLFSTKKWHERIVATAAAYNFPADPVLVQLKNPRRTSVRKSVFTEPLPEE